ncbi:hypothetical protein ABIA31_001722 [Catenulispora sp. MAP5-51]|uniref:hypothetical protein n=1 Tax=Catenulispora sp. MAP5-51 TaxID=3156298 RepID=UPI003517B6DB
MAEPVSRSMTIFAPADVIFAILADPRQHVLIEVRDADADADAGLRAVPDPQHSGRVRRRAADRLAALHAPPGATGWSPSRRTTKASNARSIEQALERLRAAAESRAGS